MEIKSNVNYYPQKLNNIVIIKKIYTIHYQEIENDYKFAGESHDFYEIMYVDKNEIDLSIDNTSYHLNEKQLVLIKPNSFHSLRCKKDTNIFIISFECKSPTIAYFENQVITLDKDAIKLLSNIIHEAKSTYYIPKFDPLLSQMKLLENPSVGGQQMIKNYLELFLISLLRKESEKVSPTIIFYTKDELSLEEQIIKYLKDHIYSVISLDDLVYKTNYSKSFLCASFKKSTKTSIMNYYMKLKIQEAKSLLKKDESIKDISEKLNFTDTSHFTNSFKKITGETPHQYKNRL